METTKQVMSMSDAFGLLCSYAASRTAEFSVRCDTEGNGFRIDGGDGKRICEAFHSSFCNPNPDGMRSDVDTLEYEDVPPA